MQGQRSQLYRLAEVIDRSSERLGKTIAWLALVLVLVTALVVLLRYAFQTGSIALQESLLYMNALLFTLGAAYTLKQNGHVRVDIFYNRFSARGKAFTDIGGTIFLLLPVSGYILWSSWDYVAFSWEVRERSAETSGLPFVYLLKTTILLLGGFLFLQGISELLKSIQQLSSDRRP